MQTLTVINRMLATMGEAPLASIEEDHAFRGACISTLDTESKAVQARGWWFNMEDLTLNPMLDKRIVVPGDFLSIRTDSRDVAQRGRYLYDLSNGTLFFDRDVECKVIRHVPFADLPETAASYISAKAVLWFQMNYDGDEIRTRRLEREVNEAYAVMNIEHTRARKSNFIDSNVRLQRLKYVTRGARRFIR